VTQRREDDLVKVLSGVMLDADGETMISTGTPISMMIENTDQRSKDYGEIARQYRPGHADYTYDVKYGIRDYRGGGRSSARETAARVAAGGIARKVVPGVTVRGALVQIGKHKINRQNWDWARSTRTRSSRRTPRSSPSGKTISTASARRARRSAPSSKSLPKACRPASARRSTQARPGYRLAADVDQRRQGRRDRQRLRAPPKSPARKMPTRCAWAMTASRSSCRTMPAVFSAASRPASR
jgi:hypothetical protein